MEAGSDLPSDNNGEKSTENDDYWEKEKQIKVHEFFGIGWTFMMNCKIVDMFDRTILTFCSFLLQLVMTFQKCKNSWKKNSIQMNLFVKTRALF